MQIFAIFAILNKNISILMKNKTSRYLIILFFLFCAIQQSVSGMSVINSKNDTIKHWKSSGNFRFAFNQIGYSNWAQGGENSVIGNTAFDYSLKYDNKKITSISTLNLGYGIVLTNEDGLRKNDDKLHLSSKLGYLISKTLKYSLLFDLKSQFAAGYKYPNDTVIVSDFFAPGYITLSFGTDWSPVEYLSILISPASGKFTIVSDADLANQGKYGMQPAVYDTANNIIEPGSNFKGEFGMNFIFSLEKEIFKNVNVDSKLELHNNYFAIDPCNRWNFDVNMETSMNFTINKYLTTNFYFHMLYDHDILIALYDSDGVEIGSGPRMQIKENLGVGLSFKF